MGIFGALRRGVGLYTAAEAADLAAKSNPALPSFVAEATTSIGGGADPRGQNFAAYLAAPGQFATVTACVDAVANAFAAVPWKLMRSMPDGAEEVTSHPLLDLIDDPNPEQGAFAFKFGIAQQMGYTGEGIIATDSDRGLGGRLVAGRDELWIMRTDRMAPVPNRAARRGPEELPIAEWVYTGSGGTIRIPTERVAQIKRPHPTDPWRGLSPLKTLETTLSIEWHLLRSIRTYLTKGARPGGILTRKDRPSPEDVTRFTEQFSDKYGGSAAVGKWMLLWGDEFQVTPLGDSMISPAVLEFLDYTKQAIMAVYKVPPFQLASPDGTTWANSRQQQQMFYHEAVIPLVTLVLDTLNSSPLVQSHDGGRVYFAPDYSAVEAMQPDRAAQMTQDAGYVKANIRTINEVRASREFGEPVEWGDAPTAPASPFGDLGAFGLSADDADSHYKAVMAARAISDKGEARAQRWKAFVRRTQTIERAWARTVRPLFQAMHGEVADTLERLSAAGTVVGLARKAPGDQVPISWVGEEWIDERAAAPKWTAATMDLATRTLQTGAEDVLQEIAGMFVPFDTSRPEVVEFVENRLATQIRTILQSRQSEVRAAVQRSAENGQTVEELSRALREMFSNGSSTWSMRIARTETAGLYNAGSDAGMVEAGIEQKEWLSARDSDVRTTHRLADRQAVPTIGGVFRVGDATGPFPGQMSTAKENINCRCTTIPVI
jgi:SPP1 gp7 family putative phage head morphogenesis protein